MERERDTPRRSLARTHVARALWHIAPGLSRLQVETLLPVHDGLVRVETLFSGISRGTERLVVGGAVPESEWQTMRAPMQDGEFSFPIKYGYCAAGRVADGPADLVGRTVFCLHPHQDQFVVRSDQLALVPDGIPARRATLAANAETALNAIWDSGVSVGDRVAVIGAGVVGLLVGDVAARKAGCEVILVDVNPGRRQIAEAFGLKFCEPNEIPLDCDCVFHTTASGQGLATAINAAGFEATVVEMSWYGAQEVAVALGGAFHSKRLRLISSQVANMSPSKRARWDHRRRLQAALTVLDAPHLDILVANDIAFEEVADKIGDILTIDNLDLPPVIRYSSV